MPPTAGATPGPDAPVAWAREHMANGNVARRVVLVEELPLNASNQILSYRLRKGAWLA